MNAAVQLALQHALRDVNVAYEALPQAHRPDPATSAHLDREIDIACKVGDQERALAAIAARRTYWLGRFSATLLNAPLGRAA